MSNAASSRGTEASGRATSWPKRRVASIGAQGSVGYRPGVFPGAVAERWPDRAATVMARSGEVVTYTQLDAAANRLARVFHALGLRPGDHMAFCLENHPRFFEVAWGAHYAGLRYTAVSTRLTPTELAYIVDDSDAKVF